MRDPSTLSSDSKRLVMQDDMRDPSLKQHESVVLQMSGDRAKLSTTLAQPWSGELGSAEAERAATQADQLGKYTSSPPSLVALGLF